METFVNISDLEDLARGTDCYYQIRGILENSWADRIRITRCEYCIYGFSSKIDKVGYRYCSALGQEVPIYWFCASGTDGT